jgi:hypothetical protein
LNRAKQDVLLLSLIAAAVSICSYIHFLRSGELLLYGDAVAHVSIARRVIDSLTPGPLQLGTVWLPLPHLAALPFVWSDWMWQTGTASSIGSMVSFVLGSIGIYRLAAVLTSRLWAWIAALAFLLNPNLMYMQATPMTESMYLALMIWAVVYYEEFSRHARASESIEAAGALTRCGLVLAGAMLTRYDGWFLTVAVGLAVLVTIGAAGAQTRWTLLRPLRNFILLGALVPALWFGYNFGVFGNAMEFATGQYSAKGIAERTTRKGDPPHPGSGDTKTASLYFLKTSRLNVAEGAPEKWLFAMALAGLFAALGAERLRPAALLWVPVPFYALSIAYSGVPIFIPYWWPFSYYNVRYGLQLLPALAVFGALLGFVGAKALKREGARVVMAGALLTVIAVSYVYEWRATPICLREARVNSRSRMALERALGLRFMQLPPGSTLLMYTSSYVGALQFADIHLKRTVNEGNYGIWQRALGDPAGAAQYVVAADDDEVAKAIAAHPKDLETLVVITVPDKPSVKIYRSTRFH